MKHLFFSLVLLFGLFITKAQAQTYPLQDYIDTWLIADKSQTAKAAFLFDDLSKHKDTVLYQKLIKQLEKLVAAKNNARLSARFTMYKALWYLETEPKNLSFSLPATIQAIKMVYPLNDKQLNAELYGLYGELSLRKGDLETSLLYNLKALELQEQQGVVYFPKIAWMYFSVARSLYHTQDYEQAVNYGLKCMEQIKSYKNVSSYDKVFLYDIIGSAYYKIGKPAQATAYYQEIRQLIKQQQQTANPDIALAWGHFWLGLIDGYLGRIAVDEQRYNDAAQLFEHAISASLSFREMGNAASFTNDLAKLEVAEGKYAAAKAKFQKAYQWSKIAKDDQVQMNAALGLAQLYRVTGNIDSSYYYYDHYHQLNSEIQTLINKSRLNEVRAKLDYDNLQDSLGQSEKQIKQERLMRNAILLGIILVTIIVALFYNRSRLRAVYKHQLVENEVSKAKEQLEEFRRNTREKDAIIRQLTASIHADEQQHFAITEHIILTDEDWVRFKRAFSKAYPTFLPKLKQQLDHLTPAEERLSALLYLQLTSNQIANTLGISKDSADRSKRRLKQRLGITPSQSIEEYLLTMV